MAEAGVSPLVLRTLLAFGVFTGCAVLAMQPKAGSPALHKTLRVSFVTEAPAPPSPPKLSAAEKPVPGLGYFEALTVGGADDLAERDRADAEDQSEILRFGGQGVRRGTVEAIRRASRRADVDPALLMAIADKESSFANEVKASTSSATGLFQFIESTWFRAIRQFGPAYGLTHEASEIEGPDEKPFVQDPRERERILSMRSYPYLSALLAAECIKSARGKLAQVVGREPTVGEIYLTHFLGTEGANLFMQKFVAQPKIAAASVFRQPARANKPIFYAGARGKPLSIAGVHDKFEDMMDQRVRRFTRSSEPTRALAYSE